MNTSYLLQNQSSLSAFFVLLLFLIGFGMIVKLLICFLHIYPGLSKYLSGLQFMLLCFPCCNISTHFSISKLFGSPIVQRHVLVDVKLMQAIF